MASLGVVGRRFELYLGRIKPGSEESVFARYEDEYLCVKLFGDADVAVLRLPEDANKEGTERNPPGITEWQLHPLFEWLESVEDLPASHIAPHGCVGFCFVKLIGISTKSYLECQRNFLNLLDRIDFPGASLSALVSSGWYEFVVVISAASVADVINIIGEIRDISSETIGKVHATLSLAGLKWTSAGLADDVEWGSEVQVRVMLGTDPGSEDTFAQDLEQAGFIPAVPLGPLDVSLVVPIDVPPAEYVRWLWNLRASHKDAIRWTLTEVAIASIGRSRPRLGLRLVTEEQELARQAAIAALETILSSKTSNSAEDPAVLELLGTSWHAFLAAQEDPLFTGMFDQLSRLWNRALTSGEISVGSLESAIAQIDRIQFVLQQRLEGAKYPLQSIPTLRRLRGGVQRIIRGYESFIKSTIESVGQRWDGALSVGVSPVFRRYHLGIINIPDHAAFYPEEAWPLLIYIGMELSHLTVAHLPIDAPRVFDADTYKDFNAVAVESFADTFAAIFGFAEQWNDYFEVSWRLASHQEQTEEWPGFYLVRGLLDFQVRLWLEGRTKHLQELTWPQTADVIVRRISRICEPVNSMSDDDLALAIMQASNMLEETRDMADLLTSYRSLWHADVDIAKPVEQLSQGEVPIWTSARQVAAYLCQIAIRVKDGYHPSWQERYAFILSLDSIRE